MKKKMIPAARKAAVKIPRMLAAAGLLLGAPMAARAVHPVLHIDTSYEECSVKFAPELRQSSFRRFVREFGSVSSFKQMGPPGTIAKKGVSVGLSMFTFPVDQDSAAWNDTFAHPNAEHWLGAQQTFPKLDLRVGVSDRLDLGIYYTRNPESNYGWLGLDGKYRLLSRGGDAPLTLAVRGAYTRTLYVSDMDMNTFTFDISAEKKYREIWRPYLGLGGDFVFARETSDAVSLHSEIAVAPHLFGGLEVNVWRNFTLGAEFTLGSILSEQFRIGAVF